MPNRNNQPDDHPVHWVLAPTDLRPEHATALRLAVDIRRGELDPATPPEWSFDVALRYAAPTPDDLDAGLDALARDPRGLFWFADDLIERSRAVEEARPKT